MKLFDLIQLKEGDKFKYRDEAAIVQWTYYSEEYEGESQDKTPLWSKNFGMFFITTNGTEITLRSCHPNSKILELPEYSK